MTITNLLTVLSTQYHVSLTIHYFIYICTKRNLQFLSHVSLNGDRKEYIAHFLSASSPVYIYSVNLKFAQSSSNWVRSTVPSVGSYF